MFIYKLSIIFPLILSIEVLASNNLNEDAKSSLKTQLKEISKEKKKLKKEYSIRMDNLEQEDNNNLQEYNYKLMTLNNKISSFSNTASFNDKIFLIRNLSKNNKEKQNSEERVIIKYSNDNSLNNKNNIARTLMTMSQEVKRNSKAINKKYNIASQEPSYSYDRDELKNILFGLSLDGGGVRGLITALWLRRIEEKTKMRIHNLFDYIGGTSIGGILALGVSTTDYSADDFVHLFTDHSEAIFPPTKLRDRIKNIYSESLYGPEGLENLLQQYFGDLKLSQSKVPVLTTAVNITFLNPDISFTFESEEAKLKSSHDFYVKDAARATSAAPTFFPSAKISNCSGVNSYDLVDGGIWLNNPSRLVADRMLKLRPALSRDQLFIVSLGTGETVPPLSFKEVIPSDASLLSAALPIINTMMSVSSEGVHKEMQSYLGHNNYLRVQGILREKYGLDKASPDILEMLENIAEEQYESLKPVIKLLVKRHK